MKKFLLGTVGLLALGMAAPASAADLAARPYTKAPPPMIAPIYDWTGFYIGANGDWADLSNQRVSLFLDPAGTLSTRTKTDGIGLFTGQIGYAWNASLFYFKGGAAVTSNRFSVLDNLTGVELAAASATRWGGTVGVGWEYGFAPNWSAGIEYDHLFMGHANNSFTATDLRLVRFLNDRISQDVDMVTLRINYRFGGYGVPVAARY